jgi:hypothetical protein
VLGTDPAGELRHQPDQLIHGQRQNVEHQMAHDLHRAANPHRPGPEVILQPSVGPLGSGAFGVADRLGEAEAEPLAQGLPGSLFLLAAGIAADIDVDDRNVMERAAVTVLSAFRASCGEAW